MARNTFQQTNKNQYTKKREFQNKNRVQIEGRNAIIEALNANRLFKRILIDRNLPQKDKILEIIRKARGRRIEIEFNARGSLDYISETNGMHQGVIGIMERREQISLKQLLDEKCRKRQNVFLMILTDFEDERNLGAVIRTAVAAKVDAVIVPKMNKDPVTPVVTRTSAGMTEHIQVISESIFQALKIIKENGIKIFAVELGGKKTIYDVDLTGDIALIIGGEDKGVSKTIQEYCDETLLIPMLGKAQSLNMSVSAALVMYEKLRQEKFQKIKGKN